MVACVLTKEKINRGRARSISDSFGASLLNPRNVLCLCIIAPFFVAKSLDFPLGKMWSKVRCEIRYARSAPCICVVDDGISHWALCLSIVIYLLSGNITRVPRIHVEMQTCAICILCVQCPHFRSASLCLWSGRVRSSVSIHFERRKGPEG